MSGCALTVNQLAFGFAFLVVFTFGIYVGIFIMRLRKG